MPLPEKVVLCQYRYDPLDWLISHQPSGAPQHQRFYCKSRLATEIQGATRHSIFQEGDLLLAQQRSDEGVIDTSLFATDQQRSVLNTVKANQQRQPIAYSPYGYHPAENELLSLLGFNGERPDPVSGHYLLGNGYRAFNPVLMRFNSSDNLSPFGKGGLSSYMYCLGDPINLHDTNGRFPLPRFLSNAFEGLLKSLGRTRKTYISGPEKLFKTSTTSSRPFTYVDSSYRGRRHSSPSALSPPPSTDELKNWDFLGFHGSTEKNSSSLISGLNAEHMGTAHGLMGGKGFYVAPHPRLPIMYAINSSIKNLSPPGIFGAYTKNYAALKLGRDYRFGLHAGSPNTRKNLEIVIKEPAYNLVVIREGDLRKTALLPKSYESPL
ncbi:RHS repeat-associated core domain-containing protein [Pseudomonas sp. PP3]|uniref:RHS repeat-associated core domain-containing protein n=1 Tax=Pseudomonas sp. PP3 TaxID=2815936 RepID=UPI001BAE78CA|nr:RHS repeat-associated core domain-containing protein [Pseudomonas sp. PP3]